MRFIYAIAILIGYYGLSAGLIAIFSRFFPKLKELSRKAYHLMACLSVFILVFAFNEWYLAVLAVILLASLVYIILPLASLNPKLKKLSIGRGRFTEVLKQASYFFLTVSLLIAIIWGLLGSTYKIHIIIGLMILGVGDAAAALVGKRFGKHHFKFPLFDSNKTIEGSAAMAIATFVGVFLILIVFTDIPFWYALISSIVLAFIGSFVEATCIAGLDTIVIPVVTSFTSICLSLLALLLGR
ncbi:MAG: hypothetical protein GX994_05905 [Firmicutes bacterium]|nr:hypothetical protein [Bacillota bacterium]